MSEENVELAREALDTFFRGDRNAWIALRDQDFEIVTIDDWPDAGVIRGGEAGWDFYLDVAQTLNFGGVEVELIDAGADKVLGHQRNEAQGQASGAGVEFDYWIVTTVREGKILRDEWFSKREQALEAAGLSE